MYRMYVRIIENVIKVLWLALLIKWLFGDMEITTLVKQAAMM